jgi:hypothetical protein
MSRADDNFESNEWQLSPSHNFNKIMVVEFNTGGANFIPVRQSPARQAEVPAAADDSSASFSTQSLQQTLKQSSSVRPDKVAQANALLSDGTYPSDAALNQLAGFFAKNL